MSKQKHTKGVMQVTAAADLSLFLQMEGDHDIIASFGGLNGYADSARLAACWNALAGIDDPEAFMRDVREGMDSDLNFGKILALFAKMTHHLKGGDK